MVIGIELAIINKKVSGLFFFLHFSNKNTTKINSIEE